MAAWNIPGTTIHHPNNIEDTRRFAVKYAGLVPEISCDIDPSGRTDLLRILDQAETLGQISIVGCRADFAEDTWLDINCDALTVRSMLLSLNTMKADMSDPSLELMVPLHMLASVGFVQEEALNIVPLKIGEAGHESTIYHLALLYTRTPQIAEQICYHLAQCFQFVYRESMSALDFVPAAPLNTDKFASIQPASTTVSSCSPYGQQQQHMGAANSFLVDKLDKEALPPSISTTTTSQSSKNTVELINDYLTMLSACLTHEELNKFALLMKRWRAKEMPILEFAQKLLELYGMERKHLLARMKTLLRGVNREELEALSHFLYANGVTENAAETSNSPFWTADMSLTSTEESSSSPIVDNISGCSGKWSSSAFAGSRNGGEAVSQNSQPEGSAASGLQSNHHLST